MKIIGIKTVLSFALLAGMCVCARDLSTITGADIVRENAKKESGYSTAQLQKIAKALKGRELTFENGKIMNVSKDDDDGSVDLMVSFSEGRGGLFSPSLTLKARVPAGPMAKLAERLDEGAKIRRLTGRVAYNSMFFMFLELDNVTVLQE